MDNEQRFSRDSAEDGRGAPARWPIAPMAGTTT